MLTEDQSDAFRRAITRGNAAEGMAIAHRLSIPSYHPDGTLNMSAEQKSAQFASQ
jgi:hypothetical protein